MDETPSFLERLRSAFLDKAKLVKAGVDEFNDQDMFAYWVLKRHGKL